MNLDWQARRYPGDLTDREWAILEPLLPKPGHQGRPRLRPLREILNGIFYALRSGCSWRMLPKDFPAWQTVYHYFRRWKRDGTWERIHTLLRARVVEARPVLLSSTASRSAPAQKGGKGLRWGEAADGEEASSLGGHAGLGAPNAYSNSL